MHICKEFSNCAGPVSAPANERWHLCMRMILQDEGKSVENTAIWMRGLVNLQEHSDDRDAG